MINNGTIDDEQVYLGYQQQLAQRAAMQGQYTPQPQYPQQPAPQPQNHGMYGGRGGMPSFFWGLQQDQRAGIDNNPLGCYRELFNRKSPVPGCTRDKSIVEYLFFSDRR